MQSEYSRSALRIAGELIWQSVRIPTLALLLAFEPLISVVLGVLCVLLTLCALFYEKVVHAPHFPFWGMLGAALACAMGKLLYGGVIAALSQR